MHKTERRWRDHYDRIARAYDWRERIWSLLWGISDTKERRKLVGTLQLKPGQRLLEVSVGTGSNLPLAAEGVGPTGRLVGLDISIGMLMQCQRKVARHRLSVDLIEGEAAQLPVADSAFDAVLHFGAISYFDDKHKKMAIDEMVRVTIPGGRIVISDVGLPPDKRKSLRSRLRLRVNPRHADLPPMELIPPDAKELSLTWYRRDTCYLIDFVKP